MPFRRSNIRLCVYAGFYVLYLVIGASVFSAIEGPQERSLVKELKEHRNQFFTSHQQCMTDAELEAFIVKIVQATNHGISAVRNVTISNPNWSFGQAFFFAGTVITTIGYGRVTPLSRAGKGFCIVFTVIGIPMTLVLFTALVERLMIPMGCLLQWMMRKLGHIYKVFHIKLIHVAIVTVTVIVFFFLIPAAIYLSLEPTWNYLDAFYYCFISLTTIGLGDYIPGDSPDQTLRPLYKVATTCYLFIGLVMMMLLLAVIYEIPELNLGFHLYLRSDDEESERLRLNHAAGDSNSGQRYTQQIDDDTANGSQYKGIPSFPRPTSEGYTDPNDAQ